MPQVTVFDMTGKSVGEMTLSDAIFRNRTKHFRYARCSSKLPMQISVRAHSPPSPVPKFPAAAESRGDRRALWSCKTGAPPELRSGHTAVSLWVLSQDYSYELPKKVKRRCS